MQTNHDSGTKTLGSLSSLLCNHLRPIRLHPRLKFPLLQKFPFDRAPRSPYVRRVENSNATSFETPRMRWWMRASMPRNLADSLGRRVFRFLVTVQGIGAFALITLGVTLTKFRAARAVTFPSILHELNRSGLRLLPMFLFMAAALGLAVISQVISRLTQVGATDYLGSIMVLVVVRELGPIFTAMLVMSRSGTANVIELGTARALGEVEALESMGIDPVHYMVMPRVIGMTLGVFALTSYFIISSLVFGYLWAFLQAVPLRPYDYFEQLAGSLTWLDFVILAVKSSLFGLVIAIITCYHGLAQPLQLGDVSGATIRAVAQSIIACVMIDAVFIFVYIAL
jgi:phospholipid/cholesterol/gamma-HCH transport system permease protein